MNGDKDQPVLVPFGPDFWYADGPAITGAAGFHFPTRMCVIRLPGDAGLWVWSPIALSCALQDAVDTLGTVRHLIAPNNLHFSFLEAWARAYPKAQVHAAPGLSADTAQTTIHAPLTDDADPRWADIIDQVVIPGNRTITEVAFFHRPSGTLILTD